jgi:hypothetical protein
MRDGATRPTAPELPRRARGFRLGLSRQAARGWLKQRHTAPARGNSRSIWPKGIHVLNEVCLNQLALTFGESTADTRR